MAKTAVANTSVSNSGPTHEEIAAQAYQIYLREGCAEGRDLDHWLRAEAELRERATNENSANGANGHSQGGSPDLVTGETRSQKQTAAQVIPPPTTPIGQVNRANAPKKPGKREAAAAS